MSMETTAKLQHYKPEKNVSEWTQLILMIMIVQLDRVFKKFGAVLMKSYNLTVVFNMKWLRKRRLLP